MKSPSRLTAVVALSCALTAPAVAQETVPGKFYVTEITGAVTSIVGEKVLELHKGDSFPAQGARIETGPGSSLVLVYSNGTSLFVDENTSVEIKRFDQRSFPPGIDTTVIEPSISWTIGEITRGRIVISTNQLVAGTSMVYHTPHAQVKIRGKQVVIEVKDEETRVAVPVGDVTLIARNAPPTDAGQLVKSGQLATVSSRVLNTGAGAAAAISVTGDGHSGGSDIPAAETVEVVSLPQNLLSLFTPKIDIAERAQRVVIFETVGLGGGGGGGIIAREVLPADLPVPLTVSPSSLRTGG